jgi:hypothetical protein
VERLVKFEVLGEAGLDGGQRPHRRSKASPVHWVEIEKKLHTSERAFQRPIMRKKIEELTEHYRQCRDDGAVPAIPGAILLTSEEPVAFTPHGTNPFVGLVQMSQGDGTLRVLDGQHRSLLAPWGTRVGSSRFETAGAWKAKAAGGGKETTRVLARELVAGLGVVE